MITYPVIFSGKSTSASGMKTSWDVESSGQRLSCSIPQEFEGVPGYLSPEDFYLLAVNNCFIATFKVYAHYSKLSFNELRLSGDLVVDLGNDKKPVMKKVHLKIHLTGIVDQKKAQLLINKTLENGFILQSIKTEISYESIIEN